MLDALRLGVHQLLSTRVASHAAVNESVELARSAVGRGAAGFANAVLRRVSRDTPGDWMTRVAESARSDDERLGLLFSHPVWVVRAFRRALAAEGRADELEALLTADNAAPARDDGRAARVSPRFRMTRGARRTRRSASGSAAATPTPRSAGPAGDCACRTRDRSSPRSRSAVRRRSPTGERWLDLCAGPGGKTAVLAAEALRHGARLEANEISPARAGLVRQALAGVPLEVPVSEQDGRVRADEAPETYDRILVDAPCTGLGALRRRPEARWRKSPADVPELTQLQGELLDVGDRRPQARRDRRLHHVLAAPRRDRRRRGRRAPRVGRGARRARRPRRRHVDRRRRPRSAAAGGRLGSRAAVAAPAQHRRDVDHAAAPRSERGRSSRSVTAGAGTRAASSRTRPAAR